MPPSSPPVPGNWFAGLQWLDDRMLCNGWVYEFVRHSDTPRNEPGGDCFRFYKSKGLVDQYDAVFSRRPDFVPRRIFELGIWDGGSVALWFELFQPRKHVAIDLTTRGDSDYFRTFVEARTAERRLKTFWGVDQADVEQLQAIVASEFDGPLDLVIDDASHVYRSTLASFEALFPHLAPGGLYIIEDWGWEHWEEYHRVGHVWAGEDSLTRLVHEGVECVAGRGSPIAGITVVHGFVVVERSRVPLPAERPFRLREHITRRPAAARTLPASASPMAQSIPPAFVISWRGQHERAVAIADAVRRGGGDVTIVFSDPDLVRVLDTDCPAVRRPDQLFWGDKFAACLHRCDSDAMLVIQADCGCDDWPGLVQRFGQVLAAVPQCAVWAPHIDGTPYASDVSTFARLSADGLFAAAQTDGIVLGLARPALDRLRQARLDDNLYGWGIDFVAVAAAYSSDRLAVIDLSQRVKHPQFRGYPTAAAQAQCDAFLQQLSPVEREWHERLLGLCTAGVAVKARRSGVDMPCGRRLLRADGPETTAELDAGLEAAKADLRARCDTRLAAARAAAWSLAVT
jgi:hypothetical protein